MDKIKLSDLLDSKFLEQLQNTFATEFNVSILTVDENNSCSKITNSSEFCNTLLKSNKTFKEKCLACHIEAGKNAAKCGKPITYACHAGFTNFAVPILIGNEHVGTIVGGQVIPEAVDISHLIEVTKQNNVPDEKIDDIISTVRRKSFAELNFIANSLFILGNTVSKLAYRNYELLKMREKELFLNKILQLINQGSDTNKILETVAKEIVKIFPVQRVVIAELSSNGFAILQDYKTGEIVNDIRTFLKSKEQYKDIVMYWYNKMRSEGKIIVFDDIETAKVSEDVKNIYRLTGIKSAITSIIQDNKDVRKVLVLGAYGEAYKWTQEDINFLDTVATQISLALNQAELHANKKMQAERELAILNNIPYSAWLKDKQGKYLAVNTAYLKSEHLKLEDVLGKTDFELYSEALATQRIQEDIAVINGKKQSTITKSTQISTLLRWVESFKTPVFDSNGEVIAVAGVLRDITEEREIEQIKSEFISMVSHELRTPLTSIIGGLGLLTSGTLGEFSPKTNQILDIASSNAKRLLKLINDILDIEKIEAGKMQFYPEILDFNDVVREAVEEVTQYAELFKITVQNDCNTQKQVKADKMRLIQVITNLLSNAIKFSEKDSPVVIEVELHDNLIQLGVINKGSEIPKECVGTIFKKFSQVDSSDSRSKGGTGLGLSISKMIMEKLNGDIWFKSKNNKTAFYIALPTYEQQD